MQDINMYIAVFDHHSVCVPSSCCLLGNKAQFIEQVLLSRWWFVDMFLESLVFLLRVCLKQWASKCEIKTARLVSVGLGLHCMLGLRSAILNKPRASLCLLGVSSLLRLILQYLLRYLDKLDLNFLLSWKTGRIEHIPFVVIESTECKDQENSV